MSTVVATHGHCFDGLASAVLFTRLLRAVGRADSELVYRACGYGAGQKHPDERMLAGDENAILDFRFSPSEKLTWYFDHHRTAFRSPEDRLVFEAREASGRFFFDADCSSCTKLVARVNAERFGVPTDGLSDLVGWADKIDAARFDSAEEALSVEHPVMRLVSVVEHHGDDRFLAKYVPALLSRPLPEVAGSSGIQKLFAPIGKRRDAFIQRVKERGERLGRVVLVDLGDGEAEAIGKFAPYALYPDCVYSIVVATMRSGVKVSVGYNPWSGRPLDTDVSAHCARYGGGGHTVVGGIPFPSGDLERARAVAREIARALGA